MEQCRRWHWRRRVKFLLTILKYINEQCRFSGCFLKYSMSQMFTTANVYKIKMEIVGIIVVSVFGKCCFLVLKAINLLRSDAPVSRMNVVMLCCVLTMPEL